MTSAMNSKKLLKEFDRQVEVLVEKNYAAISGLTEQEFLIRAPSGTMKE